MCGNTYTFDRIYSAVGVRRLVFLPCPLYHDHQQCLRLVRAAFHAAATNIRAKIIRWWRGSLFRVLRRMHGHLDASEENGSSRGAFEFQRGISTACWGRFW